MGDPAQSLKPGGAVPRTRRKSGVGRILRYAAVRLVVIMITVVLGVYLTIWIANMGGHVDKIRRNEIEFAITQEMAADPTLHLLSPAEYEALRKSRIQTEFERQGLDKPFFPRSFGYLWRGITLNLGRAEKIVSDSGSPWVADILRERLFPTLLLFATAQLLIFFISVFVALRLSRQYGSWLDRLVLALAPTSAAPSWFYGIFLILLFAAVLGWLPYGNMVDAPPPENRWRYALSVLEHMILPVLAQIVASLPYAIYNWRTFFLIYSSEDYVEMAKAKGLSAGQIERRYVLRPTLPTILTNFSLMLISLWTGSILLERVFNWPGLGTLIYSGIQLYDTPIIVGSTVIYAYLLGLTVFVLDVLYAIVDPRVKIGNGGRTA